MGRRSRSFFGDIIEIVGTFPWWVGFSLGVLSFLVLHWISGIEVAKPEGIGQLGSFAGKQLYVTLASFGQFVLPVVFVLGSFVSLAERFRQRKAQDGLRKGVDSNFLFRLTWKEFETLVGDYFRGQGYGATQTGGNGPDGGVDLILTKGNEKYLVQCKQWKAYRVGVKVVRELYGVMASSGADGGFVITSGIFTGDARRFASGLNIELIDGAELCQMLSEVGETHGVVCGTDEPEVDYSPSCPKCGGKMAKKVAQKGASAGKEFWGCENFPDCKGSRSIRSKPGDSARRKKGGKETRGASAASPTYASRGK